MLCSLQELMHLEEKTHKQMENVQTPHRTSMDRREVSWWRHSWPWLTNTFERKLLSTDLQLCQSVFPFMTDLTWLWGLFTASEMFYPTCHFKNGPVVMQSVLFCCISVIDFGSCVEICFCCWWSLSRLQMTSMWLNELKSEILSFCKLC